MTTNFRRTFGAAASPLPLSYLDENFNQLENTSTSTVTLAGAALVGYIASGSGSPNTAEKKMRERVTFDDFLTDAQRADAITGSPTVDMTAKIQEALDSGAKYVEGVQGRTYLVSQVGTKTFRSAAHRYCLLIPDGVTVDLNGATVKLAASANAAIFMNSTAGTTQNTDIGLVNGVLDGNETNQTSPAAGDMACAHFYEVLRLRVENIRVKDARQYFGRFLLCDNSYFNNLNGKRCDGDGWSFGVSGTYNVSNSFIDNIYAEDVSGSYAGLVGNGFISTMYYTNLGKVETVNCAGGIKIQGPSNDVTAGQLLFRGGANGTTNSGVKIQGQDTLQDVKRINIGLVSSENADGQAFYALETLDVNVGSIVSYQDAETGSTPAVEIDPDSTNTSIGSVTIREAGQDGLAIDGINTKIGTAIVYNSGQITASRANVAITATADGVYIGSLLSADDQGTHTAERGLNLVSGSKNIQIGEYHSRGDYTTTGNHLVDGGASNLRVGTYRIDDTILYQPQVNTTQVGNTGGGEDDLQTLTIPARSLYLNGKGYRITAHVLTANNSNPKTFRLKFGGTTILTTALTINQASQCVIEAKVYRTGSSTQESSAMLIQNGATSIIDIERNNPTETDTSAIIVKGTGEVTDGGGGINNNDIQMRSFAIEPI